MHLYVIGHSFKMLATLDFIFLKSSDKCKNQEAKRFSCLMLMFFEQLKIITVNN